MVSRFKALIHARNWYARYERPISSLSLVGGFVFNAIALTRVDEFKENFWIAIHLLVAAGCILLLNRQENDEGDDPMTMGSNPARLHFWLINILQFMFGGLLSTFLVFYFRSAALSISWPFMLLLLIAFIANESFKRHYARLYFQVSFLFFSIFLFAIFFIPVLVHDISPATFVGSGIASLLIIWLFLKLLKFTGHESLGQKKFLLFGAIMFIFGSVNVLYFFNFIPPLPLALHDAGVYHSITRTADGNYSVVKETETWTDKVGQYFGNFQAYHNESGKPVYVYSSVFSPTDFAITVIHEWQKYDEAEKKWNSVSLVTLPTKGGRVGGYRTYSARTNVSPGKWRVTIKIPSGQVLGQLTFSVIATDTPPPVETEIKK